LKEYILIVNRLYIVFQLYLIDKRKKEDRNISCVFWLSSNGIKKSFGLQVKANPELKIMLIFKKKKFKPVNKMVLNLFLHHCSNSNKKVS